MIFHWVYEFCTMLLRGMFKLRCFGYILNNGYTGDLTVIAPNLCALAVIFYRMVITNAHRFFFVPMFLH